MKQFRWEIYDPSEPTTSTEDSGEVQIDSTKSLNATDWQIGDADEAKPLDIVEGGTVLSAEEETESNLEVPLTVSERSPTQPKAQRPVATILVCSALVFSGLGILVWLLNKLPPVGNPLVMLIALVALTAVLFAVINDFAKGRLHSKHVLRSIRKLLKEIDFSIARDSNGKQNDKLNQST